MAARLSGGSRCTISLSTSSSRTGASSSGEVPRTAASSAEVNSGPSTAAARIASWAAGLSRSTRDLTRRSSTWGSCGPGGSRSSQVPSSRTRARVSSSEVSRSSTNSGLPSALASTAARTSGLAPPGTADGTGDLADERLDQRLLGGGGQRPEHDLASRRGGGQGRDLLAAGPRPAGGEHQQRPVGGQLRELEREAQRGRVGPVQVLEDQDGRARDREPGHHRAERGERHPLQVLGAHPAGRGRIGDAHHPRQRRKQVGVAHEIGQRSLQGRLEPGGRLVRRHPDPAGHQLPVEPVGGGGCVGGAAALEPQRQPAAARADPGDEALPALLHQAGLAQPGLAGQHDDRASALDRLPQRRLEDPHLGVAADQRGSPAHSPEPPLADPRPGRLQVAGDQRARIAAERHLLARSPGEQVAGHGPGRRADQDRSRPRGRLQRGGHAHHVAERAVLHLGAAPDRAHHRRAGFHADPQRRPALGPTTASAAALSARNAARTARSGSSSCACGAPNIACRPRPDTEVTVPPNASTSVITAASEPPTISRSVSRPTAPASPAGAATSANSTLTGRRSSLGSGCGATAAPQAADAGPAARSPAPRRGCARPGVAGRRVQPLERRGDPQPELLERGAAALEHPRRQLGTALREVGADQRARGLLAGRVMVQAGLPGRQHVVAAGPPRPIARSLARARRASWHSVS